MAQHEVIDLELDEQPAPLAQRGPPQPRRARKRERQASAPNYINLVDDDERDGVAPVVSVASARASASAAAPAAPPTAPEAPRSAAKADTVAPPAWLKMRGVKRVMGELASMRELVSRKEVPIDAIELVGDDAMRWQFTISQFDTALPGGRALNADLAELKRTHGLGHVLMELRFPKTYPNAPFALRVVQPRMRWYTGHVTAGGSVCMELLTCSGTDNSWQSTFTVEGVLLVALTNMIDCESTIVKTATGPGGRSGPLRIDLRGEFGQQPMVPYSEQEATAAFSRMLSHHAQNGW